MIRVMLVDDHAVLRNALAFLLESEGDVSVVASVGSLAEARALLGTTVVDVALVDLDLPDGWGLALLPDLHRGNRDMVVIVLTGSIRPESRALAIAAGAMGYLHKSADASVIRDAVRQVAAGQPLISPRDALVLMREAAQYQAHVQTAQQMCASLTARERDVLRALAAGLDNQAIADQLHVGTETVRTHVTQVLRKLGQQSRLQAALFAVRHGLVSLDDLD
jgi:DNA-binding NarL/FixJ family response regulator